jgi:hypothetical protein
MNTVNGYHYDAKQNLGRITINDQSFSLLRVDDLAHFNTKTCRYRRVYRIRVANDWNMSNAFDLTAVSIKALIRKIERHEHRLVKP